MKRGVSAGALVVVALAVVSLPAAAQAEASRIVVTVDACEGLSADEIARLAAIELAGAPAGRSTSATPRAELTCHDHRLRIHLTDPITDKELLREIELAAGASTADRTVAQILSSMLLTSWSELLLAPRPKPAELPTETDLARDRARVAIEQRAGLVESRADKGASDAGSFGTLTALMGARMRQPSSPALGAYFAIVPAWQFGAFEVAANLAYEGGSVSRSLGSVGYSIGSAAGSVGYRVRLSSAASFVFGLDGGGGYVELHGAARGGANGTAISGALGEVSLRAGLDLAFGSVRVGVRTVGGWTFPRVVAHVQGDRDVALDGPFVGAMIDLAIGRAGR